MFVRKTRKKLFENSTAGEGTPCINTKSVFAKPHGHAEGQYSHRLTESNNVFRTCCLKACNCFFVFFCYQTQIKHNIIIILCSRRTHRGRMFLFYLFFFFYDSQYGEYKNIPRFNMYTSIVARAVDFFFVFKLVTLYVMR